MPKAPEYPRPVKVGSAVVKIYRVAHANSKKGYLYTVAYKDAGGVRRTPQFADPAEAELEARIQAGKISSGNAEAAGMGKSDREELLAIRKICGETPAISAIREWAAARDLTEGNILPAAKVWRANSSQGFKPIEAERAVDEFIAAMEAKGSNGEITYRAKLKPIIEVFRARHLHTIGVAEWAAYLQRWENGVTRNDHRKRTITMCRWCRKQGYLPRGAELEINNTEFAPEKPPEIGIISPETYGQLLNLIRDEHPHYLAALVLTGFCGMRAAEVHGGRAHPEKRQIWEHIHLKPEKVAGKAEKPYVEVTAAKTNTPANRRIPLGEAAIEWLALCPKPQNGVICKHIALERVRDIGITAGLDLPDNCFRHSYISYRVSLTGNKHLVATDAGTSVKYIDRNYRRPVSSANANFWFKLTPSEASKLPKLSS